MVTYVLVSSQVLFPFQSLPLPPFLYMFIVILTCVTVDLARLAKGDHILC